MILLRTAILFMLAMPASANEIIVVVRQDSEAAAMTQTEVANLFLGREGSNNKLIPFDQDDSQLRERFYRDVADLSLSSVRAYWAKRVFTGRGRPPGILKQHEMEQVLKENPAAVLYSADDQQPAGSRILFSTKLGGLK